MMEIEVRLFATFREGRNKKYFLEVRRETSMIDIIKELGIEENEVSLALLNGIDGSLDREIKDRDVISLFPPVGGG